MDEVTPGDIVQINPEHDETFGGSLMVVEEVKSWGFQGYVEIPGKGKAYYRVPSEQAVRVGRAAWAALP